MKKPLRLRLRPGLPVHLLTFRIGRSLGYPDSGHPAVLEVDEDDLASIREELGTEVLQTIRTPQGLQRQIVSKRAPYNALADDRPVLDFLEVFEEPPPAPPAPTLEELHARQAELDRRETELYARELAAELSAAADAEERAKKASEESATRTDLAGEIHELLAETPAPETPAS